MLTSVEKSHSLGADAVAMFTRLERESTVEASRKYYRCARRAIVAAADAPLGGSLLKIVTSRSILVARSQRPDRNTPLPFATSRLTPPDGDAPRLPVLPGIARGAIFAIVDRACGGFAASTQRYVSSDDAATVHALLANVWRVSGHLDSKPENFETVFITSNPNTRIVFRVEVSPGDISPLLTKHY